MECEGACAILQLTGDLLLRLVSVHRPAFVSSGVVISSLRFWLCVLLFLFIYFRCRCIH